MLTIDVTMDKNMGIKLQIRRQVQNQQKVVVKNPCPFAFFSKLPKQQSTVKYPKSVDQKRKKQQVQPLPFGIDTTLSAEAIDDMNTTKVYHLRNVEGSRCAIFKPCSLSLLKGENLKLSSEMEVRNEIIAYQMDEHIFNLVPETQFADLQIDIDGRNQLSSGSVQLFIANAESCADFGSSIFNVDDVHKIGILDCRILNLDRHSGNILMNKDRTKMIPIDHALSLPSHEEIQSGMISFEWLMFPQSKIPFSDEIKQKLTYLQSNWRHDVAILAKNKVEHERIAISVCANVLLTLGSVKYNKTLFDIGSMMQRDGNRSLPSIFETMLSEVDLHDHVERVHQEFSQIVHTYFAETK